MTDLSPAEKYAAAAQRVRDERTELFHFRSALGFELDDFQVDGCRALEEGRGVLVAAPTGAGKTIVGEFAVHLAITQGRKAFYTTPIKALSNQKYHDLVTRYGADAVGLLTGDTTINGSAQIVVMTTEVLRNMLYANSSTLDGLGYVVMDEVHYLADRFRGPVWEEVILHLAPDVQVVSLSATVSNAEEFGAWLEAVRGDMAIVVSEHRPVPLWQHVVMRGGPSGESRGLELYDLYGPEVKRRSGPPRDHPDLNPELLALSRRQQGRGDSSGQRGATGFGARNRPSHRGKERSSRPLSRYAAISLLDEADLLPAIFFIFSRAGCEGAVQQCLAAGLNLTTPEEALEIRAIIDERTSVIPPSDLGILGFATWVEALSRGISAHHAGLLPLFKETVEELFSRGLVKVVFATETLALGINMPARSVVLEKLVKWDGSAHVEITPGEYTQFTGRAGRRGIDIEGHAVVLDHAGLDPLALAGLASKRLYPLNSAFKPTYNMAVNLVEQVGHERARDILEMSFAQFQADRGVVGLARQSAAQAEALEGYEKALECEHGNIHDYLALRDAVSRREKELASANKRAHRSESARQLEAVQRGDVIEIPGGRRAGYALILDPGPMNFDGHHPLILTDGHQLKKISSVDVPHGLAIIGKMKLPKNFNPRNPSARRDMAAAMREALRTGALRTPATPENPDSSARRPGGVRGSGRISAADDAVLSRLKAELRTHPVHGCAERETHLRWAKRWTKLNVEHTALNRRINNRTGTIAVVFDRTCQVLTSLGYLEGQGAQMTVTANGKWLRRLYAEKDLLLAECLRNGAWDELSPSGLAAAVSTVVYEAKRESGAEEYIPGGPQGALGRALDSTTRIWSRLDDLESSHQLGTVGELDFGIVEPIHKWASGRSLDSVLRGSELAAGDFVRWCKQILDVLDQISKAAPNPVMQRNASKAIEGIRRGVVAYSSV